MKTNWVDMVAGTTKVTWVALIATKIDILSAIVFLVFFSLIHSMIVLYYSRQSKENNIWFLDFIILTFIATGAWVMFTLFWILSWRDELTIYMFWIIWSLLGIKWINALLEFFSKKMWINLSDKKEKCKK